MADLSCTYTLTTPGPDIVFNTGTEPFDGTNKYWISNIQGLDMPTQRSPMDMVPFGNGSIIHTFWANGFTPVFDGVLILGSQADCQNDWNDLAFDLVDALASIRAADGTLTFQPDGQSAQSLTVRCLVPVSITYSDDYRVAAFNFGLASEAYALA